MVAICYQGGNKQSQRRMYGGSQEIDRENYGGTKQSQRRMYGAVQARNRIAVSNS